MYYTSGVGITLDSTSSACLANVIARHDNAPRMTLNEYEENLFIPQVKVSILDFRALKHDDIKQKAGG